MLKTTQTMRIPAMILEEIKNKRLEHNGVKIQAFTSYVMGLIIRDLQFNFPKND
jgi:hypothetical protein